ncbi:MAG: hypothetical protein HUJ91_07565, partial [Bacteroidales bacterium]|nr:hypothetical protein [Bacteroidales bacterium]
MKRYLSLLAALLLAATSAEARTDHTPRNAADFGFRPTASAEENARALQKALDLGGTIQITEPGIYDICSTMLIGSNTTLEFGAGVQIRKQTNRKGEFATYVFINRGAFSKTYDENIRIEGLTLICNGLDSGNDVDKVIGMMGHLSFYYVKHLAIDRFTTLDGTPHTYAIQVCSFEDLSVTGARIEGMKDAVHLCRGNKFVIRDCIFKTYDDPLAFNAHDYLLSVPELGWIEDGVVENC